MRKAFSFYSQHGIDELGRSQTSICDLLRSANYGIVDAARQASPMAVKLKNLFILPERSESFFKIEIDVPVVVEQRLVDMTDIWPASRPNPEFSILAAEKLAGIRILKEPGSTTHYGRMKKLQIRKPVTKTNCWRHAAANDSILRVNQVNARTDQINILSFFQCRHLPAEARGMHDIIGIHPCDVSPRRQTRYLVQSRRKTKVGTVVDQPYSGVG